MSEFMDATGAQRLVTLNPDGSVPVAVDDATSSSALTRAIGETNRLLRKLIAGLELIHGQEFPEVE